MSVPENAVSYDAQKNAFVQVPDKSQKEGTHKVAVVVGLSNGSQTEIVKGLKEGDQVVLQQQQRSCAPFIAFFRDERDRMNRSLTSTAPHPSSL